MTALATTTEWDRHAILAAIKRRCGSLARLEENTGLQAGSLSVALGSPSQKGEAVIAAALQVPVQQLWPDRYMPDGTRRRFPNRAAANDASQKRGPLVDEEGAR